MTKRERFERTLALEPADKVPFVPAVYEHKARLVGRSPSEVCRDLDLLTEALEKELEIYDPDALTVGIDVYNVEAEAAGCEGRYFGRSPDVPAVAAPLIDGPARRLAMRNGPWPWPKPRGTTRWRPVSRRPEGGTSSSAAP